MQIFTGCVYIYICVFGWLIWWIDRLILPPVFWNSAHTAQTVHLLSHLPFPTSAEPERKEHKESKQVMLIRSKYLGQDETVF